MRSLLEQMACGEGEIIFNAPSQNDITMECTSLVGYMECINDMMELELVSEGIDFKGTMKKLGEFAKTIYDKAINLVGRLIVFVQTKILKKEPPNDKLRIEKELFTSDEDKKRLKDAIDNENAYVGPSSIAIRKAYSNIEGIARLGLLLCTKINNRIAEITRLYAGSAGLTNSMIQDISIQDEFEKLLKDDDIRRITESINGEPMDYKISRPNDIRTIMKDAYKKSIQTEFFDDTRRMTTKEFEENMRRIALESDVVDDLNNRIKEYKNKRKEFETQAKQAQNSNKPNTAMVINTVTGMFSLFIKILESTLSGFTEMSDSIISYRDGLHRYIDHIIKVIF